MRRSVFTDRAGPPSFAPKARGGIREKNKDLTPASPACLRWSTCPLLFASQDFTPVIILEFLSLSFIFPL